MNEITGQIQRLTARAYVAITSELEYYEIIMLINVTNLKDCLKCQALWTVIKVLIARKWHKTETLLTL